MSHDPLYRYLKRRDRRSFLRLVERERDAVLGVASRALGDRALAEDATQEVFMSLLSTDGPTTEARSGRAWLVRRTLNVARDLARGVRRRRAREAATQESREEIGGADALSAAEAAEVRDAVAGLPGPLRECVELRYFGGMSAREVASALGLARRSVDERLAAARERLRTRLAGRGALALVAALEPEWSPAPVAASPALRTHLESIALQVAATSTAGALWT